MNIDKILQNPRLCMGVLGITQKEFNQLLPLFTNALLARYKKVSHTRKYGGGRNGNIKSPTQKLFFILFYFKSYPTFDVCAYIFASSKTSTCDWVKDITPLLEDTLGYAKVLPERQLQSIEEFHILFPDTKEILIDGVERPIQRPSKDKTQKKHYSGKKKRHTRKSIIITDTKKKVLVLAPTKHGRVHDKKMSDKFSLIERIPEDVAIYGDSGFQGIQKQHHNTYIPFKGTKKNQLSKDQKWWNTQVSHVRVRVEHALSGMKRFKIFADILRAKCGKDDRWSRIVAGLWNLHLSFT